MKALLVIQNTVLHYRKPLYNELSKYYDVTVLHSGDTSVGADDRYKEIITTATAIGPFVWQSGVLAAVRRGDYDVVVCMFDLHWVNNTLSVFVRSKGRFLYWGHRYGQYRVANRLRDTLMRLCDGVVLYSDAETPSMNSRGILQAKIFVAPNTIHIPNHSDGSGSPKDSFLFVGRAQKRKKVDVLIRAFSEALPRVPDNIMINIIGSGPENERLKLMAHQLGVASRVTFHGEIVDPERLRAFFHRAYAYVSPGALGLGVLHSFAYGVPIVTDSAERHGPEFDNVAHDENALLYVTNSELREILVRLCNERLLSARLGKNAYALYAKERTLERMVVGFRDAIDNRRQRAG